MNGLSLRQLVSRLRATASPDRWVRAEAFDPGFDQGDSAYQAVHAARNGRVYFTLCSHRIDTNARLGCFDPPTGRILFVRDVGDGLRNQPRAIAQGKLHAQLGEADGGLFMATVHGYYQDDRRGFDPYPGFHMLRFDTTSGELQALVRGPREEEGVITGVLDPERLVYHGLTYPSGRLCRYDIRSGDLTMGAPPCGDTATRERIRGRPVYPVCRSLGLDAHGNVYGACRDGSIWRREPGGAAAMLPGVNVLDGAIPPVDRHGREDGHWRVLVRSERERCFYGIHSGTQSLFRFDPERSQIEPLSRIGVAASHRKGHAPYRSQLGLAFGPGEGILYHIAHGPPVPLSGGRHVRTTAYLVSYDLDRGRFVEHGPLCTDAGERVLFAESLAADASGALYTVGWVEVTDRAQVPHYRRLRSTASNGECRGEIYRMLLLRVRPGAAAMGAE